jgi:hypothetical protein
MTGTLKPEPYHDIRSLWQKNKKVTKGVEDEERGTNATWWEHRIMTGTLKPEPYHDIRSLWQKNKKVTKGVEDEDSAINSLSHTKGWKILKEYIDNLKLGLDKRLAESVLGSLGSDQIKTDALFSVLGKELLDSIVKKVEDTSLAVEEIISQNEREQRK